MTLLAPFLVPLIAALVSTFVRGRALLAVNLAGSLLLLFTATTLFLAVVEQGELSLALGNWPLPYAIEFYADGMSAVLVLLIALTAAAAFLFQLDWRESTPYPTLSPLMHGLVASSVAVALAADLFNLYVWFELMLIAVIGLLALGRSQRGYEAAFKYFVPSMLGTLIMLAAIGLIHGATGQLNFTALRHASNDPELSAALTAYTGLLVAALLLKAGAFPLFSWLPAAYHTLPAPLLALVGGLMTKLTAYALLRLTGQVFDATLLQEGLGWLAVVTMVSGVLGAAYHWDIRRILAFHIISQVGYLLLGLALASHAAAVGTGFFLFHNILVKANLFLIAGLIWLAAGHYDLRRIGGIFPARPLLAGLFLLSAFSLVGVPPTSGFWGKLLLLQEAFGQERYWWGAIALATGLLTLYSMSKIWLEGFWKPSPVNLPAERRATSRPAYAAVVALSLVILWLGLYPDPLIQFLQIHSQTYFGGANG